MPNQQDFERINRIVVAPLTTFYGAKFPEGFIEALVEDLSRYSDDTLRAAVIDVRRTCRTTPRIANLIEACDKLKPAAAKNESKRTGFHCAGKCEHMQPEVAREILSRPEGRRRLELGVASDLLVEYETTGRKEFDEWFLQKAQDGQKAAAEAMRELSPDNPMYKSFRSLYEAMQVREKDLYRRFAA